MRRERAYARSAGLLVAIWIGVLPAPVDAQTRALEQQPQTAAPRESMAPKSPVVYRNGRLTIDVNDYQMQRLLADIGTRTRIAIDGLEVVGDTRVTVSAADLAPDEALRRLLTGYDAFFLYGSSAGKPAALTTVWIYPKGEGASLVPLSPEAWMSTADALKAATYPDPAIRARALEELSERADSSGDAMAALVNALKDPDETVRAIAVDSIVSSGGDIPAVELTTLALSDPSASVRLIALKALSNSPEAGAVAAIAQADQDPLVQQTAVRLLEQLKRRKQ